MTKEIKIQVLQDTIKKINDLREYNVPILLKTIEEYEKADVDKVFIDQQKVLLKKVYSRINELEGKRNRIMEELMKNLNS